MNKLVVPGVIGAATAAAGTAGVVKYKKKKHMENEMSKAIMSVLPQDLTEEERITLTKSIMKGAFESIGLDKLAFVTCAGTLLFKDSFSNIVKEAGEEFKNDIKNEVIDAIASISEEILSDPVTDTRGAEQLNAYLRSTALPFMESGIREKQRNISNLESNVKGLEDSVNNVQFYQVKL
jgi:hypothetical protein